MHLINTPKIIIGSLLVGDFNAEDSEPCLSEFLHGYNAENIVNKKHALRA